jgi:hypothetical protein
MVRIYLEEPYSTGPVACIDPEWYLEDPYAINLVKQLAEDRAQISNVQPGQRPDLPRLSEGLRGRQRELVYCSIFAPPEVSPGQSVNIQVLLHLEEQLIRAAKDVLRRDPSARRMAFDLFEAQIAPGDEVTFYLDSTELIVDEPIRSVVWKQQAKVTQFQARVTPTLAGATALDKIRPIEDVRRASMRGPPMTHSRA